MRTHSELDRLGDEIAELSAHLEAATARLLDRIREFDPREGWNTGFRSCAAWLAWRVGLDLGAARERVRVARALGTLPRLAQALAHGQISYAKVREVTRVATPETEERLLAVARAGTAKHVERIVRGWRRVDRRAEIRETARQQATRALHVYQDEDGTVVVRGRRTPEAGACSCARWTPPARRCTSERVARMQPAVGKTFPRKRLRCRSSRPTLSPCSPRPRCTTASIPAPPASATRWWSTPTFWRTPSSPGQSVLDDGARVPAETSQRLACDAGRVVMRHDGDGRLVEIGARTRTIPPALRRALQHRDHGCRFPGCGVRVGEGHHIRHWARGGPTTLANLALLCRRHHRAVHKEGYEIARAGDGALMFRRPDGRSIPDVPDPPELSRDPVDVLRDVNTTHGLTLSSHTSTPGWRGERLDVGWAIDVLHPLATEPAATG